MSLDPKVKALLAQADAMCQLCREGGSPFPDQFDEFAVAWWHEDNDESCPDELCGAGSIYDQLHEYNMAKREKTVATWATGGTL